MLIRITNEQIVAFWDIIKFGIENSFPPTIKMGPNELDSVLEDLLSGMADCWVSYQRKNTNQIDAIIVTKVIIDTASKVRNLLIYSLFAYTPSIQDSWTEGIEVLAKWARKKKCYNIIGYTSEPLIIDHVNKLGGDTSVTLVRLPINKFLPKEV